VNGKNKKAIHCGRKGRHRYKIRFLQVAFGEFVEIYVLTFNCFLCDEQDLVLKE
jgi:hypothetical protein